MNTEDVQKDYAYRWVILLLALLVQIFVNIMSFQIGGLAGNLMQALKLQPTQLAMLLSVPMLASAIIGIPAGALADRFGVKRVVWIGLIVTTIGAFGRITADSFITLFVWMFLLGFGGAFLNANISKLLGAWFNHKQMGMAMGIYVAGAGMGITIALATSPFFTSVQTAFTFSGIAVLGITLLWLLLVKNKPAGAPDLPAHPMTKYLGVAAKSKNIWIGGIAIFFMMGTYVTHSGFLSNALVEAKGINPVQAGLVASSFTLAFIVGGMAGPVLANKAGLFKPFLAPTAILCAISSYLAWNVPFGPLTFTFLIIAGLLIGASAPLIMSLPMTLPEIGPIYAGSAGGIISTMQMAGAFIISSYVIIPLAGPDINKVFLYIAIGYLIYGIVMLFLPELGPKAKTKS
ncbi:sugar phosphate permease [Desulfosporosinus orientis DSM 765]|uniref:Sugar phosphate permease n=1 Tax=Desulfosporosinus orientis (strain ATCC 19365 / DSM 765 / NCIMB 8382 / VKM B-1628 / Singapore I) TaxID=768706 RepID=G7W6D6_DESOD|nr:MFS transporter [Desulfosporosinus orientis]AET68143.1 sugar phosphate permease [Desulfosporosinus orientis DSM 765]